MTQLKQSLHGYYKAQEVLPTFAALPNENALRSYMAQREQIFREKLHLPVRIFNQAKIVEFGPDSGENALVFARWGAHLTLVEPNPRAWGKIDHYFEKFNLKNQLDRLHKINLEQFRSRKKFDFIVAEGFIYCVHPAEVWIDLFRNRLKPGGFLIMTHMESSGMMFDLLWRVVHGRMKRLTGLPSLEVAQLLFLAKWGVVPHTRSFASWVMDMLENPFVRLKFCYDAGWLYERMEHEGFELYSSWPKYQDGLHISWHKRQLTRHQRLARDLPFLKRSHLSYALGKKAFLFDPSDLLVREMNGRLSRLVSSIDALIDSFEHPVLDQAIGDAEALKTQLSRRGAFCQDSLSDTTPVDILRSLIQLLRVLGGTDSKKMIDVCSSDPILVRSWGLPYHLTVFRRDA
jgi:predicted O-methyltransferase YrrM